MTKAKPRLSKVDGKMTPQGADRVGLIQSVTMLIAAILFGSAAIIYVIKM